jgi:fatty-acyl-CoA synthase
VTADELIEHCRSHLARFKCLRETRFKEAPKTSTGTIKKHLLRKRVGSARAFDASGN